MFWDLKSEKRGQLEKFLNGVLVLCSTISLALFVYILGWPIENEVYRYVQLITDVVLGLFVVQEIIRIVIQKQPWGFLKTRKPEIVLSVVILLELFFGSYFHGWLRETAPNVPAGTLGLFLLGCSQFALLVFIGLRFLRENRIFSTLRLSPGGALVLSFASLILIGTLLLKTPQATHSGIGWVDALFTATSSVCVTGLGTVDMATGFTRQGHWIILGLVQIGGLGMMTLTYFFAYFLAGGVSLRNQTAIQNLFSEDNLGQIGTVLGVIVGFTLTFEVAGAMAIYFFLMQGGNTPADPVFFSIFHSVSAFCNAGISTLPGNLADPSMQGYEGVMSVIMILIITGGIGFPVVKNFWQVAVASIRKRLGLRTAIPPRLTTNSRVVLVTSFVLLIGGAVLIYITEFVMGNGDSGGASPWFIALFHSVASRSAGFNVTDTGLLNPGTLILVMALMFVGGSPSSTAGGIKTSTVAVAFLALRRVVLGLPEIEAFGRRISDSTADRALAIILLAGTFFVLVAATLCALHPELPPLDMIFEAVGAVSTAGLGRGITPKLGDAGKLVMVAAMFIGRIGVLMFLLSFIPKREHIGFRYPEATIVIT